MFLELPDKGRRIVYAHRQSHLVDLGRIGLAEEFAGPLHTGGRDVIQEIYAEILLKPAGKINRRDGEGLRYRVQGQRLTEMVGNIFHHALLHILGLLPAGGERLRGNTRELLVEIFRIVERNLVGQMRHGFLFGEAGLLKDGPDFLIMETEIREAAAACRIKNLLQLRQKLVQSAVSGIFEETVLHLLTQPFSRKNRCIFLEGEIFHGEDLGREKTVFSQPVFVLKFPDIRTVFADASEKPGGFRGFFGGFLEDGQDFLLVLGPGQDREAEFVQTDEFQGKLGGQCFLQRGSEEQVLNTAVLLNSQSHYHIIRIFLFQKLQTLLVQLGTAAEKIVEGDFLRNLLFGVLA